MGIDLPGMPSAGSLLNEVRRVQAELAELRAQGAGLAGRGISVPGLRDWFIGRIQAEGPDGEADYGDERYWVQEVLVTDEAGAAEDAIALGLRTNGRYVTATNLDELAAGTHSLAADDTEPVVVSWVYDAQDPRVRRFFFRWGLGGGDWSACGAWSSVTDGVAVWGDADVEINVADAVYYRTRYFCEFPSPIAYGSVAGILLPSIQTRAMQRWDAVEEPIHDEISAHADVFLVYEEFPDVPVTWANQPTDIEELTPMVMDPVQANDDWTDEDYAAATAGWSFGQAVGAWLAWPWGGLALGTPTRTYYGLCVKSSWDAGDGHAYGIQRQARATPTAQRAYLFG